ncbi:MAG: hypothetical protein ACLFWG_00365 [Longimicrobiales bacterium]
MSRILERVVPLETIGAEAPTGWDGQGGREYGSSTDIEARVLEREELVRTGDGEDVVTTRTVYVDGGQEALPRQGWRLTISGTAFVVVSADVVKRIMSEAGAVDHHKCLCREE